MTSAHQSPSTAALWRDWPLYLSVTLLSVILVLEHLNGKTQTFVDTIIFLLVAALTISAVTVIIWPIIIAMRTGARQALMYLKTAAILTGLTLLIIAANDALSNPIGTFLDQVVIN